METEELIEEEVVISEEVVLDTLPEKSTSVSNNTAKENASPEKPKLLRLPLARIKHMMKMDPDVGLISNDAAMLITKATEMFLSYISEESVKRTLAVKRKTLNRQDIDNVINSVSHLCFLDGALE